MNSLTLLFSQPRLSTSTAPAFGWRTIDARSFCVFLWSSPCLLYTSYLALAHNPDMRIIISNTTEAGIVYTGKDSFDDKPQASYPGKLTRLLYERFTAFGGKKGSGFILLPCRCV